MKQSPSVTVDQFLEGVDPELRELAQRVRRIIKVAMPGAQELVKWGNPTYVVNGKNVAWIMVYKDHVNLGLFQGAKLKSKRLEGTGKGLRHVKVRQPGDIDGKEFTRLIKEAVAMAE